MNEHRSLTGARHLELGGEGVVPRHGGRPIPARWALLALVVAVLVAGLGGALVYLHRVAPTASAPGRTATAAIVNAPQQALPNLPPPDLLKPLSPADAIAANAQRPIVARPDAPATRFRLSGDAISKLRAIDCLTQAVYYEASSEGVDGGRAVAQVVLNRVRHPGFPGSVCGVVYQGSQRVTGCQFTFTCDGSLARIPVGYLWARSRLIATEALAGRVFAPVGHATHYHADYVVPYWADALDKVAVIGRHIFYRLRGGNGSQNAFSQRYGGVEPAPPPPPSTDLIEQGIDALAPGAVGSVLPAEPKVEEDRIKALDVAPKVVSSDKVPLAADLSRGQLILGEPAPEGSPKVKRGTQAECSGDGGVARIKAIGAEDLKANATKAGC